MAIYYKFKSEGGYCSLPIDAPFVSVPELKVLLNKGMKNRLFRERKPDFDDLIITNAQTNGVYLVDDMIPNCTSVVLRRVPELLQRPPIVLEKNHTNKTLAESLNNADPSRMEQEHEDFDYTDFGNLYENPKVLPTMESVKPLQEVALFNDDERSKIEALVNKSIDGIYDKRLRRKLTWRNFGLESRAPPQGYVCHRCKVPGHFIQFCPTNGNPEYDIKRVKPPAVEPDEAVFKKELEGISSKSSSSGEFPPELHCPLCKKVMKDAVMTTKCCFRSYCYKCIYDHIISKSKCACGVEVLADDLVPNLSIRDQINTSMWSDSSCITTRSSSENQDQDSAKTLQLKGSYQKLSPQTEESRSFFPISDSRNSNCKRKSEHINDHEENNRPKKYYPGS